MGVCNLWPIAKPSQNKRRKTTLDKINKENNMQLFEQDDINTRKELSINAPQSWHTKTQILRHQVVIWLNIFACFLITMPLISVLLALCYSGYMCSFGHHFCHYICYYQPPTRHAAFQSITLLKKFKRKFLRAVIGYLIHKENNQLIP